MKIVCFIFKEQYDSSHWMITAWDEWSINANPTGYEEDKEKYAKEYGDRFRVALVTVPDSFMEDAFKEHDVEGTVVDKES